MRVGPKPVRLVCCDEGGRREGHEAGPRAGDGGGILIYYGRDWLMSMSLVVVIIEQGKRERKRAVDVEQDSGWTAWGKCVGARG